MMVLVGQSTDVANTVKLSLKMLSSFDVFDYIITR